MRGEEGGRGGGWRSGLPAERIGRGFLESPAEVSAINLLRRLEKRKGRWREEDIFSWRREQVYPPL